MLVLLASQSARTQNVNSIYSRFGIGLPVTPGSVKSLGMGGLQSPITDGNIINVFNPASYSFLEITSLQLSGQATFQNAKTETESVKFKNGNIGEMSMAFRKPSSKWGFAIGLHPYSSVGYTLSNTQVVNDSLNASYTYSGSGGLNEALLGTSRMFLIKKKKIVMDSLTLKADTVAHYHFLSVGANMNYVFGNLVQTNLVIFDELNYFHSRVSKTTFAQGGLLQGGLLYQAPLKLVHDQNKKVVASTYLQLGVTYTMGRDMNSKQELISESVENFNGLIVEKDTSFVSTDVKGSITIPQRLTVGAAIKWTKPKLGTLLLGLDYTMQNWNEYQVTTAEVSEANNTLNASASYSFGLDYRPTVNMKDNFVHRMQYRIGARYVDSHLVLNNVQITQKAFTAGLSLPLLKSESRMHLAGEYSIFGTTENNLIQEETLTLWLGFTFTPFKERWFHVYKYD